MSANKLIILTTSLLITGCSMIPPLERPAPAVAGTFAGAAAGKNGEAVADIDWQVFYREPHLRQLIELALANNQDLRVSVLNVEVVRAQYRIQRADLLPSISGQASMSKARTPADLSSTGQALNSQSYAVGGDASYELDLFGRVRSLNEQALEQFFASTETRKAAQISLIGEVANAWLALQADHALRQLTVDTLASQRESLKIVQAGFSNQTSSSLDVAQAETSVRQAEANLAQYDRQVKQDINALTLLVGKPLQADLLVPVAIEASALTTDLPVGLPSDLLTRRPDIMAAEHSLLAANANIGAARAAFFPRISLTAEGSSSSASLSGLFDAGSAAWSFVPTITVPIFDFGRNQANLDVATVSKDIEIANYQKAIQTAFREVSDALDGVETYDRQKKAQFGLVQSSSTAYALSQKRYREGVDSYLNVLVNQRSLYAAQEDLIRLQLAQANNAVAFYRSLGGGWKV